MTCNKLFNSLAVALTQWSSSGGGIYLTEAGLYRAPSSSLLQAHHTQPTNATKTKENMPRVSIEQFLTWVMPEPQEKVNSISRAIHIFIAKKSRKTSRYTCRFIFGSHAALNP